MATTPPLPLHVRGELLDFDLELLLFQLKLTNMVLNYSSERWLNGFDYRDISGSKVYVGLHSWSGSYKRSERRPERGEMARNLEIGRR